MKFLKDPGILALMNYKSKNTRILKKPLKKQQTLEIKIKGSEEEILEELKSLKRILLEQGFKLDPNIIRPYFSSINKDGNCFLLGKASFNKKSWESKEGNKVNIVYFIIGYPQPEIEEWYMVSNEMRGILERDRPKDRKEIFRLIDDDIEKEKYPFSQHKRSISKDYIFVNNL